MNAPVVPLTERFALNVGAVPPTDTLPDPYPFETVQPAREGWVDRDGVRIWYGVFGTEGPWLVFAPLNQVAHNTAFKGVVPYLSNHFRVVVADGRGNGRSDRPAGAGRPTAFDALLRRLASAVIDHGGRRRGVALVGTSASGHDGDSAAGRRAAAARDPASSIAGGFADSLVK